MIFNVITVKFGNKYDSEFVNRLFREICYFSRGYYVNGWFKFYCYTDDPEGLMHGINVIPAKTDPTLKGVWNKLRLFDPSMPYVREGHYNIYLDLDTFVQDCIFTRFSHFGEKDWSTLHVCGAPWKNNKKRYGRLSSYDVNIHSSVMSWNALSQFEIWNHFNNHGLRDYYMRKYSGGMDRFLAHEDINMKTFKRDFVRSMKYDKNIKDAAIVSFEELDVRLGDLIPNYKIKRESV